MQRAPKSIVTGNTTQSVRSVLLAGKNTALLDELFQEIDRLRRQSTPQLQSERRTADINESHHTDTPDEDAPHPLQSPIDLQPEPSAESAETETSPAISIDPRFDSLNFFRSPVLIGEAADAAFATRFRQVITDPSAPEPIHVLRLDYASNEFMMSLADVKKPWSGPYRARFLLEAAMKYIGRSYHIVKARAMTESWKQNSHDASQEGITLRCRTWALFAIGELYISKSTGVHGFPGMAYFAQASKALGYLDERPEVDSVELYLLLFQLPDPMIRQHRKCLFWTAYIIDRLCVTNLNHPLAIQDGDIGVDLPCEPTTSFSTGSYGDSDYHVANIQLAGLLTSIIRSVYSVRTQAEVCDFGYSTTFATRLANSGRKLTSRPISSIIQDPSRCDSTFTGMHTVHSSAYKTPHPSVDRWDLCDF
ncbi:fungal specific transcription factor [Colletotrichum salicis]|uniref:Fungal specific transcription factor n=1 Tax=Colletotrichum salicis TaxID=1209931 RepID=A0A135UMC9_9PEZI|nr:fungal specific transcription factor [Colletotrichum salicis]